MGLRFSESLVVLSKICWLGVMLTWNPSINLQGLSGEYIGIIHGLFGDYVYYIWYCTDVLRPSSGTEWLL